jgi:hypothetical protein
MKFWAVLLSLTFATTAFAQSSVAPLDFQMPGGSGCAGEIARYRAVQQNDYALGNVAKSVYTQIQREIGAADTVCAAGDDARATEMVHASEIRHGYSPHI